MGVLIADIKWDEMNILQTLHPPDKDYGLMKIEEPKTPYSYYKDNDSDIEAGATASKIISSLSDAANQTPKILIPSDDQDDDDDEEGLTEEELKKKREFEMKRKAHYNEFQAVKLARKWMEEEDEEEDEEEGNEACKKVDDDIDEEELDEDECIEVEDENIEVEDVKINYADSGCKVDE
ncbi:protein phosphatase inhibitor 2-like protein [Dinothrombium tinctorium]|uniref:Protein phosphatase inhibitor 2-like protein n=1 Tax=Dinothrombium tinctorium TaxID=1965070 RepID=A0A3S3Q9W5_9ACAR|nr:protein phosphatase inhibitor 2-like protein [Dinothrombium tinctorium]RWS06005.1 protein phosphatase inhibitor 2-like protein [Dinothrombium tinctorium]